MQTLKVSNPSLEALNSDVFAKSFAATFDLGVILRYVQKHNPELTDDLPNLELQYRQFMFLVSTKKFAGMSVPSLAVDIIWHAHILHTQLYWEFCQNLTGQYIHHNPFADDVTEDEKTQSWNILVEAFSQVFGAKFGITSDAGCLFGSGTCDTTCDSNVCNLNCSAPDGGNSCTVQ